MRERRIDREAVGRERKTEVVERERGRVRETEPVEREEDREAVGRERW